MSVPSVCCTGCKYLKYVSLLLCSPGSSVETDVDPAAAGQGEDSSELYQTEDGKHITALLPMI